MLPPEVLVVAGEAIPHGEEQASPDRHGRSAATGAVRRGIAQCAAVDLAQRARRHRRAELHPATRVTKPR